MREKSLAAKCSFFGLPYTLLADDDNLIFVLDRALAPDFDVGRIVSSEMLLELPDFYDERTRRKFYAGQPIVYRGALLFVVGFVFFTGLILLQQPSDFAAWSPLLILPVASASSLLCCFIGMKRIIFAQGKIVLHHFGREQRCDLSDLKRYKDGWLGRTYFHSNGQFLLIERHPANSILSQIIDDRNGTA